MPTLQGGFVVALADGEVKAALNAPAAWPQMKDGFPVENAVRGENPHFQWGQTEYVIWRVPRPRAMATVLVAMPLPQKFAETARQIQESQQRYH